MSRSSSAQRSVLKIKVEKMSAVARRMTPGEPLEGAHVDLAPMQERADERDANENLQRGQPPSPARTNRRLECFAVQFGRPHEKCSSLRFPGLIETRMTRVDPAALEATILRLLVERGAEKSISPTEVARTLAGDQPDNWGPLMTPIRAASVRLARAGKLIILRKGRPVDPEDFKGVYRLSLNACV
jgi:hypothetical protein